MINIDAKPERAEILQVRERGLAAWLCRKSGIPSPHMHLIFRGLRNPTPRQAIVLDGLFAKKRIPLDKVDLVFGRDPKEEVITLEELLVRKLNRTDAQK